MTAIYTVTNLGGALFARKAASVGTVGRAGSAMRGVGRAALELDEKPIRPRKSDTSVAGVTLVWSPWSVSEDGDAVPLFE